MCWPPGSAPGGPPRPADRGRAGLPHRRRPAGRHRRRRPGPPSATTGISSSEPDGTARPDPVAPRPASSAAAPRRTALSGCAAGPADYDAWAAAGNPGWTFDDLLPVVLRGGGRPRTSGDDWHGTDGPIPVERLRPDELDACPRAFVACRDRVRPRRVDDHNRPRALGVGPLPRNVRDGVRMSTALTYLAPARHRPNLEIRADTPGRPGRGRGTPRARSASAERRTGRSGHGGPRRRHLRQPGDPAAQRDRAGRRSSRDSTCRSPRTSPASAPTSSTTRWSPSTCRPRPAAGGPAFQVMLTHALRPRHRRRTRRTCTCSWPVRSTTPPSPAARSSGSSPGCWPPARADRCGCGRPTPPTHRASTPPTCAIPTTSRRMVEATRVARRISRTPPLADLVPGPEINPGHGIDDDDDVGLARSIRSRVSPYHHPVGTCAMGPTPTTGAVVDATRRRSRHRAALGRRRLGDAHHPAGQHQPAHDRRRRADRELARGVLSPTTARPLDSGSGLDQAADHHPRAYTVARTTAVHPQTEISDRERPRSAITRAAYGRRTKVLDRRARSSSGSPPVHRRPDTDPPRRPGRPETPAHGHVTRRCRCTLVG